MEVLSQTSLQNKNAYASMNTGNGKTDRKLLITKTSRERERKRTNARGLSKRPNESVGEILETVSLLLGIH